MCRDLKDCDFDEIQSRDTENMSVITGMTGALTEDITNFNQTLSELNIPFQQSILSGRETSQD